MPEIDGEPGGMILQVCVICGCVFLAPAAPYGCRFVDRRCAERVTEVGWFTARTINGRVRAVRMT